MSALVKIWNLDPIAAKLGISRKKLLRLLRGPAAHRPPVRHCHRGWYAYESRLADWVDVEDIDGGVHLELEELRAIVGRRSAVPAVPTTNQKHRVA